MGNNQEFALAVHSLLMLHQLAGEKVTSEDIAKSSGSNPTNIRKIFAKLRRAGLLITKSGNGRTELARPAEQITLWDIYAATRGEDVSGVFKLHDCAASSCAVGSHIGELLTPHLESAVEAMKKDMSETTLADLGHELDGLLSNA